MWFSAESHFLTARFLFVGTLKFSLALCKNSFYDINVDLFFQEQLVIWPQIILQKQLHIKMQTKIFKVSYLTMHIKWRKNDLAIKKICYKNMEARDNRKEKRPHRNQPLITTVIRDFDRPFWELKFGWHNWNLILSKFDL